MKVSHLAKPYIEIDVAATMAGSPLDLSAATVEWAFPAQDANPVTWLLGDWSVPGKTARILFDPAGQLLVQDRYYDVHLRVAISPQVYEDCVGRVLIT